MQVQCELAHIKFRDHFLGSLIISLHAAASTGSLRGAVRALFRTAGTNGNSSAKEGSAAPPSEAPAVEQSGSKNNFSDVSLSDSPR